MKQFNEAIARSYALGYYDGRTSGIQTLPEHFTDEYRAAYTWGYDAGVTDYCHEIAEAE